MCAHPARRAAVGCLCSFSVAVIEYLRLGNIEKRSFSQSWRLEILGSDDLMGWALGEGPHTAS